MDINHNQCTMAAIEAQESGRELSRLEASVIGQYLTGYEGDFWHDIYYRPSTCAGIVSDCIADNYKGAQWDERVAWDMLVTYCLNVPTL